MIASAKSSLAQVRQPRISSTLVITAMAHMVLEFSNNYLPIVYPLLMPLMGINYTQVGFIALVSSTVLSLSQPVFGFFSDRWGAVPIVATSIIAIGFAMGAVGLSSTYAVLLILVGIGGLCSAAFHPPAVVMAARHSGKNRGLGLSVFSLGGNVGTALSPLWIAIAIGWFGLPGTLTILPVTLLFGTAFFFVMRNSSTATSRSELSTTNSETTASRFLLGMILIIAAMMFRSWYNLSLMTYLPAWIEETGGTLEAGGRILSVFLFSISIGSIIGGISGDRIGHLNVLILALLALPFLHWSILNSSDAIQTTAVLLSGVSVGTTFPNSIVLVLEAWPQRAGIATGLLMGLGWWPGGLGTSLTGVLADGNSLTYALTTLIYIPLIRLVCLLFYWVLVRARRSPPGV